MYPVSQGGRWREANSWTPNQSHHRRSWRSTSPSKRCWNENSYQSIAYNSLPGQQLRSRRHWTNDRSEQHHRQPRQWNQKYNKDHERRNDYEQRHNVVRTRQLRFEKQKKNESFAQMEKCNTGIPSSRSTNLDEHKNRSEHLRTSEHDHRSNNTLIVKGVKSIHSCPVIPCMAAILPSKVNALPSKAETLPSKADMFPSMVETLPSNADILPSKVDRLTSMDNTLPSVADISLSMADTLPSLDKTLPSKADILSNTTDALSSMTDTFPSIISTSDDHWDAEKMNQELLSSDSKHLMNINSNGNSEELFSRSTKQSSPAACAQSISRKTFKNDNGCSQNNRLHDQTSHIPHDCIRHLHSPLFENIVKRQPIVLIRRLTSLQIQKFCSMKRTARKSFSETTKKSAHLNKALTLKLKRQISNDDVSSDQMMNCDADSLAENYTICKTVKSLMKDHDNIKCHVDPKVKIFSKLITSARTVTEHCSQTSEIRLAKNAAVSKRQLIDRSKLYDGLCYKRRSQKHADRQSGRKRMWKHMAMRNFSVAPRFSSEKKYQTHRPFQDDAHTEATSPLAGTLPFQHSNTAEVSDGNVVKLPECQHTALYASNENSNGNTLGEIFYPLQTAPCSNNNGNATDMQLNLPVLVDHEPQVLSNDNIRNVSVSNASNLYEKGHFSETKLKTGDANYSTLSKKKMLKSVIVSYNPVSMCISSTRPKSPVDSLSVQGGDITRGKSDHQKSEHFTNEDTTTSQPLQQQGVLKVISDMSCCSTKISDVEENPWNQMTTKMFPDTQNRTVETVFSYYVQREQCEMNAPVCLISEVHSMAIVPSHSISDERTPKDDASKNTNNMPTEIMGNAKPQTMMENGADGDFADLQMATEALLNLRSAGLALKKHVDFNPVDEIVAQPISSNTENDSELSMTSVCRSNSACFFDSVVPEDDAESVVVPQASLTIDSVIPADMSEASDLPDQSPFRPLSDSSVILDDVAFTNSSLDEEQQASPISHSRLVLEETSSPCESTMSDEGYIKGEDLMFHEDHGHSRSSEETILYSDSDEGAKSAVNSTETKTISDCLYKSLSEDSVFHNDLQIVDQTLEFTDPESENLTPLVIDDRSQQMNLKPFIKRRLRNKIQNKQKSKNQDCSKLDPKSKTSQICPLPKIMTRIRKLNQRVDQYVKQYNVNENVPKRTKLHRKKKQGSIVKYNIDQIGKPKRQHTKKKKLPAKDKNKTSSENSEDPSKIPQEKQCPGRYHQYYCLFNMTSVNNFILSACIILKAE